MKKQSRFWLLDNFNLVKGLGKKELVTLCDQLKLIPIKKREECYFTKDNKAFVYFLISGTIKVISASTNLTKYVVKNGNIFGELNLLESDKPLNSKTINAKAIALESSLVCQIEANQMKKLINEPSFAPLKNEIMKLHFLKMQWLDIKIMNLSRQDSRTRVAECIFNYILIFSVKDGDQRIAKNLLSHSDIANLSNVSRQTVNNVMSGLRKENIINYDSKTISLVDQSIIKERSTTLEYL